MEKLRALLIIFIVLLALVPVYFLSRYFQKLVRPAGSLGRLFLYIVLVSATIFLSTFGIVVLIKAIFQPA